MNLILATSFTLSINQQSEEAQYARNKDIKHLKKKSCM